LIWLQDFDNIASNIETGSSMIYICIIFYV